MKYIPTAITDFDNIFTPIRDEFDDDDKIVSFINYYEENCGQPYALVDKKKISLVWEDPENADKKHTCNITPSSKTISFNPIEGKSSRFKASETLMNNLKSIITYWKLKETPFDPIDDGISKTKTLPLEIRTVMVKGNPDAKTVEMPNELIANFKQIKPKGYWTVTANYHDKNAVYTSVGEKRKFSSSQEAVIDLIKEAIDVDSTPNLEVFSLEDREGKKYSMEDMVQLIFQFSQKQCPSDSDVLELPVYDSTNDDDKKNYIEAIKQGDLNLVKQFVLCGADPSKNIKIKKLNEFHLSM